MSEPSIMRAAHVATFDGPSAVTVVDKPRPSAGPGELVIKVEAAGLNFADVAQSVGAYPGGPNPPFTPGVEACGSVVEAGQGTKTPVGTRVIGMGSGAFAEAMVIAEAGAMPLPTGWSPAQGASFPVQWLTAHGCLRTLGRVQKGEWVLIHAAAGGVGQAAVRIAKHFGANVVATASSDEKLAVAKAKGADVVINATKDDFVKATREASGGQGADLILEMVGGETFEKNLRAVRKFGRMVVYGAASGEPSTVTNVNLIFQPVEISGYHLSVLMTKRPDLFAAEMKEVTQLIAAGVMVPDEPKSYSLDNVREAMIDLASRRTTGKLVIVP